MAQIAVNVHDSHNSMMIMNCGTKDGDILILTEDIERKEEKRTLQKANYVSLDIILAEKICLHQTLIHTENIYIFKIKRINDHHRYLTREQGSLFDLG